jgi:hypothetical protein
LKAFYKGCELTSDRVFPIYNAPRFFPGPIQTTHMAGFETLIATLLFGCAIVLIILGSIVASSANKTDQTSRTNVKNSGVGVLVIGVLFLLATFMPMYDLVRGISFKPMFYF